MIGPERHKGRKTTWEFRYHVTTPANEAANFFPNGVSI